MELWALTLHVHVQGKTREIEPLPSSSRWRGNLRISNTKLRSHFRSLPSRRARVLLIEHIQSKVWRVKCNGSRGNILRLYFYHYSIRDSSARSREMHLLRYIARRTKNWKLFLVQERKPLNSMKPWNSKTPDWNSQLAQCSNISSELFVPRQSEKSGWISHNQKVFKAKFPFNYKAKVSLVNKRISAPRKIPLAGKWSLLWMCSVRRNLARCQGNERIINPMFVWVLEGVPPFCTMKQDAVKISLVLSWT